MNIIGKPSYQSVDQRQPQQHRQWSVIAAVLAILSLALLALTGAGPTWPWSQPGSAEDNCTLRVLAFGDSLTEGFHDHGREYHSYALHLRTLLRGLLPASCSLVIHERGRSGEKVLFSMQDRLLRTLAEASANDQPYDWVLILGGTNDIGTGEAPAAVLGGLQGMYSNATQHGALVLAMTLPPFNMELPQERLSAYTELNQGLRDWVAGQGGSEGVVLLDLEPLLPTTGLDLTAKAALWDDNLHLTPRGYDKVGGYIFEALQPHIQGGRPVAVAGGASVDSAMTAAHPTPSQPRHLK